MRLIGILIAIVLAATMGLAVLKLAGNKDKNVVVNPTPAQQQVSTVDVLVAAKEIPVGTALTPDMVDRQPWPSNLVLDQFIVGGGKDANIMGMVTRSHFQAREPLIMNKLANPNDPSFLAAALPEGMRAVTMQTDAVSSVAGFVFPGDHVDIIFTHDKPVDEDELSRKTVLARQQQQPKVSETLLTDIKVLAVDQRSATGNNEKLVVPVTVSLEMSKAQAQQLRLAEKKGTLALALRSLKDKDNMDVAAPTEEDNITRLSMQDASRKHIRIIRGTQEEVVGIPVKTVGTEPEGETQQPGGATQPEPATTGENG
jgi:pilus assembly protein CpaB